MYCFAIWLGNYPQVIALLWDESPPANTSIRLDLRADGVGHDGFDPSHLKIRTAYHDARFEVQRCLHRLFSKR